MAPAQHRTGVFLDTRVMLVGGGLALVGLLLLGFFMWMVPNAAAREAKSACTGLVSQPPINPALCPGGGTTCKYPIPAPDFTAYDHNGKQVHLSDFRGKVVLLNFWASWCGVCETEKPHLDKMAEELGSKDFVVIALASDRNWTDILLAIVNALNSTAGVDEAKALSSGSPVAFAQVIKTHPKEHDKIIDYVAFKEGKQTAEATEAELKKMGPPTIEEALGAYKRALPDGVPFDVLLDKPKGDDNIGAIAAAWGIKAVPESALIDKQGNIRHYFVNKRDWETPVAQTCLRSVIDE